MLLMQVLILQFAPKMVLNQSQKMQKLWHLLGTVTNVKSEQEYYLTIVKSEQEYIVSSVGSGNEDLDVCRLIFCQLANPKDR